MVMLKKAGTTRIVYNKGFIAPTKIVYNKGLNQSYTLCCNKLNFVAFDIVLNQSFFINNLCSYHNIILL